jgi:hypothetical protein
MTVTLRDRAEHAAKYQKHLVIPAVELKQLLDELDVMTSAAKAALDANQTAETALDRVRQLLADADRHQNAFIQTGHLRNALDGAAALAANGDSQ